MQMPKQEEAGEPLQAYLKGELSREAAWDRINERYRASLPEAGNVPEL